MDEEPLLLSVEEVCKALSIGRLHAYALIASGEIPSIKIGNRMVRVPAKALREWVNRKVIPPK